MKLSDILGAVKAANRQKLAGRVVRDEIARQGKSIERVCQDAGMAVSTGYRILKGVADKDSTKYRALEGVLDLPDDLLRWIIEGNIERIKAIRPEIIRPSLQDNICYELVSIESETVDDEDEQQAR